MSIDTENKRRSVQAFTFGLVRPVADGVIDVGDRALLTWLYSGFTYTPPATTSSEYQMFARHKGRR